MVRSPMPFPATIADLIAAAFDTSNATPSLEPVTLDDIRSQPPIPLAMHATTYALLRESLRGGEHVTDSTPAPQVTAGRVGGRVFG